MSPPAAPLEPWDDRVMRYVDKDKGPEICRPWMRHTTRGGYGSVRGRLTMGGAYRELRVARLIVAWKEGLDLSDRSWQARHDCDTPICCSPEHLRSGTPKQNSEDMVQRGRTGRGRHKITAADAEEIRRLRERGIARLAVASAFDIHPEHVTAICSGRFWK